VPFPPDEVAKRNRAIAVDDQSAGLFEW